MTLAPPPEPRKLGRNPSLTGRQRKRIGGAV